MANDHGWMETNKLHSDLTQYWWLGVLKYLSILIKIIKEHRLFIVPEQGQV